jgi:hypothetical protein
MSRFYLIILLISTNSYLYAGSHDTTIIQIQTPNQRLVQAFNWAVDMALSHVQTGKPG